MRDQLERVTVPFSTWKVKKGTVLETGIISFLNYSWGIENQKHFFPGPQPISIERRHFDILKNSSYVVCEKTDGVGHILMCVMIENKKIAMFFPWGGDEKLRQPELINLVNGLGFLKPQIEKLIDYSVKDLNLNKIAIFHSDSHFERENEKLVESELKKIDTQPTAVATYNQLTMDITTPAKKLIETDPKVVICLSTSKPTIKLINKFYEAGHYGTKFMGIDSTMFVPTILRRKGVKFSYASSMPNPK